MKQYQYFSAYRTREKTDKMAALPMGSVHGKGYLHQMATYPIGAQLLDTPMWMHFIEPYVSHPDSSDKGWRGEYWGKMMRGGVMTYQVTGDETLFSTLTDAVKSLLAVQGTDGRFSTYEAGRDLTGWDLWSRKYVMLGMLFYLQICRDETLADKIRDAVCRHADVIIRTVGPADEGKTEINKATCHWNGLNSSSILEPFMLLYNLTGFKRYLDFAEYIVNRGFTDGEDLIALAYEGKLYPYQYAVTKAYEMMSCFEGLLEYARTTGDNKAFTAVRNFARLVRESDVTIIGCCGCTHELFDHSRVRQATYYEGIMQETCVTVTWMKLCMQMLCLDGDAAWADCMEISAYNAMAAALNSDNVTGLPFDSYQPLLAGARGRVTGGRMIFADGTYYGCCAAIASAGTALAEQFSVMQTEDAVVLQTYQPCSVKAQIAGRAVSLSCVTAYPADGTVAVTVEEDGGTALPLWLRLPSFCRNYTLFIGGNAAAVQPDNGYLKLTLKKGDTVALCMEMPIAVHKAEINPDDPAAERHVAFTRGPLVLARDARISTDVGTPISYADAADAVPAVVPFPCQWAGKIICGKTKLTMTDFASAGKTWNDTSLTEVWMPIK